MSGDVEILREYLFRLGFEVNKKETTDFDKYIVGLDKKALQLGGSLVGVAAAAQVMVQQFASSMEKLYYSSKRAESSVGNLQALEYAGKRIGLANGAMTQSLEGMARALRANPGLSALLNNLGVKVTGRDKADVLKDLVGQLTKMPFYVAQQYASMFGIDPDTLLLLEQGREELERAAAARKEMASEAMVDPDAAAKASQEYMNMLREVTERVGLLRSAVALALLPPAQEFAGVINEVLKDWTRLAMSVSKGKGGDQFWTRIVEGLTGTQSRGVGMAAKGPTLTPQAAARAKTLGPGWDADFKPKAPGAASPGAKEPRGIRNNNPGNIEYGPFAKSMGATGTDGRFAIFPTPEMGYQALAALMQKYSAQGINTTRGIIGKFAPPNENNTAAYVGSVSKALGVGADQPVDVKDLKSLAVLMDAITRVENGKNPYGSDMLNRAGQIVIQQTNQFTITATDGKAVASAVGGSMDRTNGDLVRNMKGAIQ